MTHITVGEQNTHAANDPIAATRKPGEGTPAWVLKGQTACDSATLYYTHAAFG